MDMAMSSADLFDMQELKDVVSTLLNRPNNFSFCELTDSLDENVKVKAIKLNCNGERIYAEVPAIQAVRISPNHPIFYKHPDHQGDMTGYLTRTIGLDLVFWTEPVKKYPSIEDAYENNIASNLLYNCYFERCYPEPKITGVGCPKWRIPNGGLANVLVADFFHRPLTVEVIEATAEWVQKCVDEWEQEVNDHYRPGEPPFDEHRYDFLCKMSAEAWAQYLEQRHRAMSNLSLANGDGDLQSHDGDVEDGDGIKVEHITTGVGQLSVGKQSEDMTMEDVSMADGY